MLSERPSPTPLLHRSTGAALALVVGLCPLAVEAATYGFAGTVMSGLVNPRGMTIGADGALYVAEAGSGGTDATITGATGATLGFGLSGGVSRYQGGIQTRLISGLPSLAGEGGAEATGIHDLTFDGSGALYGVIGLGANPAERDALSGTPGELLGTLVSLGGGSATLFTDLAAFEAASDADGAGPDSNPFSLAATSSGFMVLDSGGNDVLIIDGSGGITVGAVLPPAPNPLPFGPPVYQAVPTGGAVGPDGRFAFGQLTGFPFPPGVAQVYGLDGGTLSVLAGGFTNLIDVAFGVDGTLYALEMDSDSLLNPGATGALWAIDPDGLKTLLFDDLITPTGLAIGSDGSIFVAVNGLSATDGSVIRLAPVPVPPAVAALAGGLAALFGWRLRRRATDRVSVTA